MSNEEQNGFFAKPVLGDVYSLEQAKTIAIVHKCKIRHRFYTEEEFIEYKDSQWVTEDGYVLPRGYFESMSGDWLKDWSKHIA